MLVQRPRGESGARCRISMPSAGGREGPRLQSLDFRSNEKPLKGFQQDGNNMGFTLKGGCVEGCLEGGKSTALGPHPLLVGQRWGSHHGEQCGGSWKARQSSHVTQHFHSEM